MRILWVCNTMLPVIAEQFGIEASNKEGWLTGLCAELVKREDCELAAAFPWQGEAESGKTIFGEKVSVFGRTLLAYGFPEDMTRAESSTPEQDEAQKAAFQKIEADFQPDVIHCFGTEFPHALILEQALSHPERLLVGLQGICTEIAKAYMANLPHKVRVGSSFRDWLKKDDLALQQEKYELRGKREREVIAGACHITGRTAFDREFAKQIRPEAAYYPLNETLRPCFYEGSWSRETAEPFSIFVSQGDYPLKGLHTAICALGILKQKYGSSVKLKVAGNSLVNYRTLKDKIKISGYGDYLRKLIRELELSENVIILGKRTAQEMKQDYLGSSVFLCCSSNENSPNSLGEAMLLGVPCVAARVGGIPSIFTEEDGILYEGFTAEKADLAEEELQRQAGLIADAVAEIWENPKEADKRCKAAVRHAKATHDREKNLADLWSIYETIAGKH